MVKHKPVKRDQRASYASLRQELDDILLWFEGQQFDLDEAEAKYRKAIQIIAELDGRLKMIKSRLEKVRIDVG